MAGTRPKLGAHLKRTASAEELRSRTVETRVIQDESRLDIPDEGPLDKEQKMQVANDLIEEAAKVRFARRSKYSGSANETRGEALNRFLSMFKQGIAKTALREDRKKASLVWFEPARNYASGPGNNDLEITGLVLMREELDMDPDSSEFTSSGAYPYATISFHALERLAERSGARTLAHVMAYAETGLSWAATAQQAKNDGEYLVPHQEGLFACQAITGGIVDPSDPSGRAYDITLMKTWMDIANLNPLRRSILRELLDQTRGAKPLFPGFGAISDEDLAMYSAMRAEGDEAVRRREYHNSRNQQSRGHQDDDVAPPKPPGKG